MLSSGVRRVQRTTSLALALLAMVPLVTGGHVSAARASGPTRDVRIEPSAWRIAPRQSGPVNYYSVLREAGAAFVRSNYQPPMKTAVLAWQTPDGLRQRAAKLAWSWRPQALPRGGDECVEGKGDSAAVVYLTWRRTLRFYSLKYVWSAAGTKGKVCDQRRNPFVAQDTVILESGPGGWQTVEIDLRAKFRQHFADGDPKADVPDFVGIGLMSDGDQTQSASSADYGAFALTLTAPR
jgi:hypothetical protein